MQFEEMRLAACECIALGAMENKTISVKSAHTAP